MPNLKLPLLAISLCLLIQSRSDAAEPIPDGYWLDASGHFYHYSGISPNGFSLISNTPVCTTYSSRPKPMLTDGRYLFLDCARGLYRYSPLQDTWQLLEPPPSPLKDWVYDGAEYILALSERGDKILRYPVHTGPLGKAYWNELSVNLPENFRSVALTWADGALYLLEAHQPGRLARYDPANNTSEYISLPAVLDTRTAALHSYAGAIYLLAGSYFYRYDLLQKSWKFLASPPGSGTTYTGLINAGTHHLMAGPVARGQPPRLYNLATGGWDSPPQVPPAELKRGWDITAFGFWSAKLLYDVGSLPDQTEGHAVGEYQTRLSDGGPYHLITRTLYLGERVDADFTVANNPSFVDTEHDDEDGIRLPAWDRKQTSYRIPAGNIRVNNHSGRDAHLHAWADINMNGMLETEEYTHTTIPTDQQHPDSDLIWSEKLIPTQYKHLYIRFRLSTDTSINALTPNEPAIDGEVEDYRIQVIN